MKNVCGLDVHKDSLFCAIYKGAKYFEQGKPGGDPILRIRAVSVKLKDTE